MKLSRFNLWVKDYPEKGEYLLFNTRTQAIIKINQQLKEVLERIPVHILETNDEALRENLKVLKENGVIVEDEKEDEERLRDFFYQLKYESDSLPFEVTILTTYSCNFRCVYCFEKNVRNPVFLDKETSDSIVRWLIKRIEKRNYKRIFLVYYGGEPLLNIRPIYDISWYMKEWAEKNKVDFSFGIITNGSLVTPQLIDKFLTVGLREIRITLDGERNTHNKRRPFFDGQPTFDLIIRNIKSVIDKVSIGITGNFDLQNVESIPKLLNYLDEEKILHKLNMIDFAPLAPRLGPRENPSAIELGRCLSFFDKEGICREVIAIKKELLSRGLRAKIGLGINLCSLIVQDGGVTLDAEGMIYKCNALVGYPEFSLGTVNNEEFEDKAEQFLNIDAWNKCPQDCPYLPMCQGGCRFFSYLENSNFYDLSCKREYFDWITPELIRLEYEKQVNNQK
jgi:uncharacterized protein